MKKPNPKKGADKSTATNRPGAPVRVEVMMTSVGTRTFRINGEQNISWRFIEDPMPGMLRAAEEAKRICPRNSLPSDLQSVIDRIAAKLSSWESLADAAKKGGGPFDEAKERKALVGLAYYAGDLAGFISKLVHEKAVKRQQNLHASQKRKGRKGRANPTWAWLDKTHPEWWQKRPKFVLQIAKAEWSRAGSPLAGSRLTVGSFNKAFSIESRKRGEA